MRRLFTSLAVAGAFVGFFAAAPVVADQPVVVELYTSQGCSSCPPADELLGKLAKRNDVIALALHVDYWDYIGWKDKFASPAFTKRQKSYAVSGGRRMVYTPQMIIDGQDHVVGNHPMDVSDLIRKHAAEGADVTVDMKRNGNTLQLTVSAPRNVGRALVQIVRYDPASKVAIKRGENAGRTLTYHNIVTEWRVVETWNGRGTKTLSLPITGKQPIVAIVQSDKHGPILGAARLR